MGIRFIHTADFHIGMKFNSSDFSGRLSSLRRKEIKDTFFRIVEKAGDVSADFLFIVGDLFEEEYVTAGELKDIRAAFEGIRDTKVIIVAGNHDPMIPESKYRLVDFPDNVYVAGKPNEKYSFPEYDTDIYAANWMQRYYEGCTFDDSIVLDRSKTNILLIHGEAYHRNSKYMPLPKELLYDRGFDYIALGHMHKPDIITDRIVYPGSPEPLDFGETGAHGYIAGEIGKGSFKIEFIPFSKREFRIVRLDIDAEMTHKDIADRIREAGDERNLYRIVLQGTYSRDAGLDVRELAEELAGDFFFLDIRNEAAEDLDIDRVYFENRDNVIGGFINEMRGRDLEDPVIAEAFRVGLEELLRYRRK